jgi:hypothetical protein
MVSVSTTSSDDLLDHLRALAAMPDTIGLEFHLTGRNPIRTEGPVHAGSESLSFSDFEGVEWVLALDHIVAVKAVEV